MKTILFRGLRINIENPKGSVRSGVDSNGKPWAVTMSNDYGEIIGSMGVDGDPVDCFIGDDRSAKWVYVIHQTKKDGQGYDEDKCMLGFQDAMTAKAAFYRNYDLPDQFYGNMSVMSVDDFKRKVMQTKKNPMHIRASKINTAIQLYAALDSGPLHVGDQVLVDGMRGRGIIVGIEGKRIKIRYLNNEYVSRDAMYVRKLDSGNYKSKYSSLNAGGPGSGRHKGLETFNSMPKGIHTRDGARELLKYLQDALPRFKFNLYGSVNRPPGISKNDIDIRLHHSDKENLSKLNSKLEKVFTPLGFKHVWKYDPDLYNNMRPKFERSKTKHTIDIFPVNDLKASSIENEGIPEESGRGNDKWIEKVGTQFCIRSNGVDKNFGCWPSREKAEAVMAGKSFIEPDLPKNLLAKSDDCQWITSEGQHICIKPGQSKAQAVKQHFAKFKDKSTNKQAKVKVGSITKGSKGSLTTNTKLDPKDLKKVGVKITDKPNSKYDDFYSNFSLHEERGKTTIDNTGKALQMFQDKFGMSPKEMEDVLLNGLPKSMQSDTRMEISPLDTKGKEWFVLLNNGTMRMERSFDFSKGTVEHILWEVKSKEQGQGIGKQVFSNQLDLYDHLGLNSVHTHANIDVGGYAWARYGFVPDKSSWSGVRQDIKTKMEVVEGKGSKDDAYDNSANIHPEQWSALKSQVSSMTSDDKQQLNKILSIKDPSAIKLIASFHSSSGDPVGKSLLIGSDWDGSLNLNSKSSYAIARAYSSTKPSKIHAAQAGPFVNEKGVKTDSALHEPLLSSEFGNNVADAVAYKIAIKNGWGPADALKYFVKSPKLKKRILKRDRDRVLAGKVIRQSPAEFKKSERRAGIKPYVDAGGPGSGRKSSIDKGLNQWKSRDQEIKQAAKDPKQMKLPLKAFGPPGIKFHISSPFKTPTQTGTKPALSSMNKVGHSRPNMPMKNGKGSGHRFSNPAFEAKSINADFGEPNAGAYQTAHIDPMMWFHPPSLDKNKPGKVNYTPTDDPMENDNKFGDVTKRNSKDTKDQRMKLLKRAQPAGPAIPVRTTLVSPTLNSYLPMSASAIRQHRRHGKGQFRAFGAAQI